MSENKVRLSVYGILIDRDNQVLLQKRANTGYADGWWSFPGGHVESDESLVAALQRELFEEIGVKVSADQCAFRLTLSRKPESGKRYINFFYVIKECKDVPIISDGKASELCFFSPTALPDMTLAHIQEALHLIEKGVQFSESAN